MSVDSHDRSLAQDRSADAYNRTLAETTDATRSERDPQRVTARVVEILKREMPHYSWVGIYLLHGNELVLGPFLGKPSPHTRIPIGSGICGAAARQRETIIVDDVNADSRYLACSLETKSEIVVPIMSGPRVLGEIDIDSDQPAAFGPDDKRLLESVASLLAPVIEHAH
jgi:L-methionine (R)-S-oxide reductase